MLAAGDEMGHSQGGNNNPYCQDNRTTWIDWAHADQALVAFTAHLIALRQRLMPLGATWYTGVADAHGQHDLSWLRRTGEAMRPDDWNNRMSRVMGAFIGASFNTAVNASVDTAGRVQVQPAPALLLLINAREVDSDFTLPPGNWVAELDTTAADGRSTWQQGAAPHFHLLSRSVVLLRDFAPAAADTAPTPRRSTAP